MTAPVRGSDLPSPDMEKRRDDRKRDERQIELDPREWSDAMNPPAPPEKGGGKAKRKAR